MTQAVRGEYEGELKPGPLDAAAFSALRRQLARGITHQLAATLLRSYQQAGDETMLEVMSSPIKLVSRKKVGNV